MKMKENKNRKLKPISKLDTSLNGLTREQTIESIYDKPDLKHQLFKVINRQYNYIIVIDMCFMIIRVSKFWFYSYLMIIFNKIISSLILLMT